jgi:hypothetical protein
MRRHRRHELRKAQPAFSQKLASFSDLLVWARSAVVVGVLVPVLLGTGCGWQEPAPETAASSRQGPRERPDDSDLAALVPTGLETVIEVDMEALRRSPWTAELLPDPDARLRERKAAALGYDGATDVDRIVYAVTSAGIDAPTIVIAQGRFQMPTVEAAFRERWSNATVDRWRGLTTLASGENGLGTLTARTFCSGPLGQVRAVIDRAFGVGPSFWDQSSGAVAPPGALRRELLAAARFTSPAILATIVLDAQLRARVGDAFPLPPELRQVAARLDLGQTMDLQVVGQLDSVPAAAELSRRLNALLSDRMTRMALAMVGMSALVQSVQISSDGTEVRARTSIPSDRRPEVMAAMRALVHALRGQTEPQLQPAR